MLRTIFNSLYYWLIPFLIYGITAKYTTFPIALIAFLPLLFTMGRHSVGFFFLMYGGVLGGLVRTIYPSVPIYGLLLQLIGALLMWDLILDFFRFRAKSFFMLAFLLAIFGIFYLMGPMDEFSQHKFLTMGAKSLIMLIGYYAFDRSKQLDAEGLVRIMMVGSVIMFAFVITYHKLSTGDFTDYNWFRNQVVELIKGKGDLPLIINYQHIGMTVLYGIAIYLSQTRLRIIKTLFWVVCAAQLIMMSGCRQSFVAFWLVLLLRFVVFRIKDEDHGQRFFDRKMVRIITAVTAVVGLFYLFLSNVLSEALIQTIEEGDSGREEVYLQALALFDSNQLTGVGLGGFHAITDVVYPHNFFLELLCECGLIGTIILLTFLVISLIRKHVGLLYTNKSEMFYFLILSTLFVKIMVSADLSDSIEIFSAIIAITAIEKNANKTEFKILGKHR